MFLLPVCERCVLEMMKWAAPNSFYVFTVLQTKKKKSAISGAVFVTTLICGRKLTVAISFCFTRFTQATVFDLYCVCCWPLCKN